MAAPKPEKKKTEIRVEANRIVGSQFAQIALVAVSSKFVTLDFVFVVPQTQGEGQIVSRVTMPKDQALKLSTVLRETIESNDKRQTDK